MKILKFSAENIKKLRVVEITPTGAVIQITGPNGSGKTSVLDAILWALGGTKNVEPKPVRDGADKGVVKLDLGDMIVTRRFTASGGSSLVVEAPDGSSQFKSPQAMLDKLLGTLSFDPLAFSRMAPKEQLEQLRKLVTVEVDIDGIDFDNRRDFEARTAVNRSAKELAARVNAITIDAGVPEEPVEVGEIAAEMERAAEQNRLIDQEETRRKQRGQTIFEQGEDLLRVEHQIEVLTQQRDQLASAKKLLEDLAATEEPVPTKHDLTKFRDQITAAQTTNALVARRTERDRIAGELAAAEGESAKLTKAIDDRTATRKAAITAAAMPVPGLGFGDGEVTFNELPFAQASGAEQLRISVAIAMAANPELRVLRIKDGSLLDDNSLALISEMAAAGDFQVWMEIVDTSGKVGIVMEDGAVAAVNA